MQDVRERCFYADKIGRKSCHRTTSLTVTPDTMGSATTYPLQASGQRRLPDGPTMIFIRPNLLHMVLYMASQIRLHCQTTLSNGLADQSSSASK